ncbi:MAG: DotI/IcmL family type IV secretion protein [Alphaproteobacteria bacterium]
MRLGRFIVLLFTVMCLSGTFSAPAKAEGWFDFFFPTPAGPDPSKTLRAPFADEDAVVLELDASGNKENQTPLHLRHRTNEKMTLWVQHNIPSMLSYSAQEYEDEYHEKAQMFNKVGIEEYNKFLQAANVLTTLKTGRYDVSGFINDYPIIINQGPADNRYKWVYQMDIMLNYIKSGAKDHTQLSSGDSISQEYTLTFQLARSREASNDAGVFIETWDVKAKK